MINPEFAKFVKQLASYQKFKSLLHLSAEAKRKQRELDIAVRFLVHMYVEYNKKLDIQEYLDEGIIELSGESNEDWEKIERNFRNTVDLIYNSVGKDGLKRFDGTNFKGKVGLIAFEVIAIGIATNLAKIEKLTRPKEFIAEKIKALWASDDIQGVSGPGVRGTQRIQKTLPFGEKWFRPASS